LIDRKTDNRHGLRERGRTGRSQTTVVIGPVFRGMNAVVVVIDSGVYNVKVGSVENVKRPEYISPITHTTRRKTEDRRFGMDITLCPPREYPV
jgi:hypothetical protein